MEGSAYVVALKGKRGDRWALKNLYDETANRVIPLLEPAAREGGTSEITKIIEDLEQWAGPMWLDMHFLNIVNQTDFQEALGRAHELSIQALPVLRLGSPKGLVHASSNYSTNGAVIRLRLPDFADPEQLADALNVLRDALGVNRSKIDLIIDYSSQKEYGSIIGMARVHVGLIPRVGSYRSVTILVGAFPDTISHLNSGPHASWHEITRHEWVAYQHILNRPELIDELPQFGDYGPRGPSFPTSQYAGSPNLRYTTDDSWRVRRGRHRINQDMHRICKELIEHDSYFGPDWSEGDLQIMECAQRNIGPGTGENWTKWAVNHHIETVVEQIADI